MFRTSDTVAAAVPSVPRISSPHRDHAVHPAAEIESISGAAVGHAVWVAPGGAVVVRSPLDNPAQPKPAQPKPAQPKPAQPKPALSRNR